MELEALMSSPNGYTDKEKFKQNETEYSKVSKELHDANKEYEVVFEKLLQLEEKLGL